MESTSQEYAECPGMIGPTSDVSVFPCLDIELDEAKGFVRVHDPRIFHLARRDFCKRVVLAATCLPGVHKAEVDLASASCLIQFRSGSTASRSMADAFVHAIREASSATSWFAWLSRWPRRRAWRALTAFRLSEGVSVWETIEVRPTLLRMSRPGITSDRARLSRVLNELANLEGVELCHVSACSHRMTIDLCQDGPQSDRFLDTVEQTLDGLTSVRDLACTGTAAPEVVPRHVATNRWTRLSYLVMAGGAYMATVVAFLIPRISTVPFLLATSYCLARSSPQLDDKLRHSLVLGPILRQCEKESNLSRYSRQELVVLTIVITSVTVVFLPLTPVVLTVIILLSSLRIYGTATAPRCAEESTPWPGLNGPPPRILSTP